LSRADERLGSDGRIFTDRPGQGSRAQIDASLEAMALPTAAAMPNQTPRTRRRRPVEGGCSADAMVWSGK